MLACLLMSSGVLSAGRYLFLNNDVCQEPSEEEAEQDRETKQKRQKDDNKQTQPTCCEGMNWKLDLMLHQTGRMYKPSFAGSYRHELVTE